MPGAAPCTAGGPHPGWHNQSALRSPCTIPACTPVSSGAGAPRSGESYADGDWDSDDLTAFLRLAHRSLTRTHPARDRAHHFVRPLVDSIARLRPPDKQRDARNVRAHYDLGDALFRRLLDDTMMYSCAVFGSQRESLESASIRKLDRLARLLELGPG